MGKPTQDQLLRLVSISDNVQDLCDRVSHQFGIEYVDSARLIAVSARGVSWALPRVPVKPDPLARDVWLAPSNLIALVGCVIAAMMVLHPPFHYLLDGVTVHAGFHSLLTASGQPQRSSTVNVPLLAVELLALAAIVFVMRRIAVQAERHIGLFGR